MGCVQVFVFLGLLSMGSSAPLSNCDNLVKPITISGQDLLGRWQYIGSSSDLPGSRSLGHLLNSVWLDITATSQSNILTIVQTQRMYGQCSSLIYNVTFENSTLLIEQPFYLKEVYLPTDCSDCLVVLEEVISGKDTFTSFLLFSKSRRVAPIFEDMFRKQAECLRMPSPMMINPDNEICPDNIPPLEGLSALNSLLEAKMEHQLARLLDTFFDMFVN